MSDIATIGLNLAKCIFRVRGVDAADTEAIRQAAIRPSMRFVGIKTVERPLDRAA